jgi:hypothetical protein
MDRRMRERGVVEHRDVPAPHRQHIRDDAEDRVRERAGGLLDPVDPPRGGAQDPLRQPEDQQDRRQIGDQQVLDHVPRGHLLAQVVDRRDQRDEEHQHATDPGGCAPAARRPSAPGAPRGAPARAVHP